MNTHPGIVAGDAIASDESQETRSDQGQARSPGFEGDKSIRAKSHLPKKMAKWLPFKVMEEKVRHDEVPSGAGLPQPLQGI